jgi:hypothetical protein
MVWMVSTYDRAASTDGSGLVGITKRVEDLVYIHTHYVLLMNIDRFLRYGFINWYLSRGEDPHV